MKLLACLVFVAIVSAADSPHFDAGGIIVSLKQAGLTAISKIVTVTHVVVDNADQIPQQS